MDGPITFTCPTKGQRVQHWLDKRDEAWPNDQHGISTSYVRKLFETEGTNFTEFVLSHRLARAYRMLTDHGAISRPISDIAHAGFNDLSYFNRTFRRVYGASPSDIRERT